MAEGYAMVTGRPGVAMVTSGPGATNIVTPLSNAYMDSTPLVVISGQVSRPVHRHRRLPGVRHHRRHRWASPSTTGSSRRPRTSPWWCGGLPPGHHRPPRPGADRRAQGRLQTPPWSGTGPRRRRPRPARLPPGHPGRPAAVHRGGRPLIAAAERPVIYAGGGILKARALERPAGSWPSAPGSRWSPPSWPGAPSPTPTRCAWACRACTATTPPSPPCSARTCSSPSAPASTTG